MLCKQWKSNREVHVLTPILGTICAVAFLDIAFDESAEPGHLTGMGVASLMVLYVFKTFLRIGMQADARGLRVLNPLATWDIPWEALRGVDPDSDELLRLEVEGKSLGVVAVGSSRAGRALGRRGRAHRVGAEVEELWRAWRERTGTPLPPSPKRTGLPAPRDPRVTRRWWRPKWWEIALALALVSPLWIRAITA